MDTIYVKYHIIQNVTNVDINKEMWTQKKKNMEKIGSDIKSDNKLQYDKHILIKYFRIKRCMTVEEFAKFTNCSNDVMNRIENNQIINEHFVNRILNQLMESKE